MDATQLIGPASPLGYPAPYWLLVLFKVLGFTLHAAAMSLWLTGIAAAMGLRLWGGKQARRLSARLMSQMPVIIAAGVNLGIVPLLFLQVAYYRVFYPATILMAWPWLLVVGMVGLGYYGVYYYAVGLRLKRLTRLHTAAGWLAALLFIASGFIFANGLTLMTNVGAWPALWEATSIAGAPLGFALNLGDPTLWPRWLLMAGLALTTLAAYVVFDAAVFAGRETGNYRSWACGFGLKLSTAGVLWYALMGLWYTFGSWPAAERSHMFGGPLAVLTGLTALSPGAAWLLIVLQRRGPVPALAWLMAAAQLGMLGLQAVSRQIRQNLQLGPYLDVTAEQVKLQLSPLIVFLVLFVAGLGVLYWMIAKVIEVQRREAAGPR